MYDYCCAKIIKYTVKYYFLICINMYPSCGALFRMVHTCTCMLFSPGQRVCPGHQVNCQCAGSIWQWPDDPFIWVWCPDPTSLPCLSLLPPRLEHSEPRSLWRPGTMGGRGKAMFCLCCDESAKCTTQSCFAHATQLTLQCWIYA